MSEPFAFLDEEEEEDRGGTGWLPFVLAGLALVGFLSIPLLGMLGGRDKSDSAELGAPLEKEEVVMADAGTDYAPVTPEPEELDRDLQSIDDTLSNLGWAAHSDPVAEPLEPAATDPEFPLDSEPDGDVEAEEWQGAEQSKEPVPAMVAVEPESSPAAPPAESPASPHYEIVVKPGDTLYSIARRTKSTLQEIAGTNGIDPAAPIHPRQKLRIPVKGGLSSIEVAAPSDSRRGASGKWKSRIRRGVEVPASNWVTPSGEGETSSKSLRITRPLDDGHHAAPEKGSGARMPAPRKRSTGSGEPVALRRRPADSGAASGEGEPVAREAKREVLQRYQHVISYRVQSQDTLARIADALSTTERELVQANGRSSVRAGEVILVPVDAALIKGN